MPMIDGYHVTDEIGRVLTADGFFSYEDDDAVEFRTEEAALEESELHPGTTVERFRRFSEFPDFTFEPAVQERTAA